MGPQHTPSDPVRLGRPPQLERTQIISAAATLTRTKGLDQFTMKDLAAELNCTPMAIYHHVENRQELSRLVVEQVGASIHIPVTPEQGDEFQWLMTTAEIVRRALLDHPGAAEHLLVHGPSGPLLSFLERVTKVLVAGGAPLATAARAYALLMTTVTGLALQESGVIRAAAAGTEPFGRFTEEMSTQTEFLRSIAPGFTGDMDEVFTYSITCVLHGIGVQ